jgi:hypothetical protein
LNFEETVVEEEGVVSVGYGINFSLCLRGVNIFLFLHVRELAIFDKLFFILGQERGISLDIWGGPEKQKVLDEAELCRC